MKFEAINIKEENFNPIKSIGDDWCLISAKKQGKVNAMTASWGSIGKLWHKNIAIIYVRPQRYTKEFIEANNEFTLTFFDGQKEAMTHLGKTSGRDEPNKIEIAGLHQTEIEGIPTFEEAQTIIHCKVLYKQQIDPNCFLEKEINQAMYPNKDYSIMYIGEITKAYKKRLQNEEI